MTAVIAASGPSLTSAVAEQCRNLPAIAVNDAYRLFPAADYLVAADRGWWRHHAAALASYAGIRVWPRREPEPPLMGCEQMIDAGGEGFTPGLHVGQCSLFAAISYALHLGFKRVLLVGADMRVVVNRVHFFGDHPGALRNTTDYAQFIPDFDRAAKLLPAGIEILNCTPGSALRCFPFVSLEDAL